MSNLVVVAPAYYPDDGPIHLLKGSCARNGLELVPFGVGMPWPWDHIAHFTGAAEAIRQLDCEWVLFTDGCDAFILPKVGDPVSSIRRELGDAKVLLAAEQSLYPWLHEQIWDSRKVSGEVPPYQYPNGGGWAGRKADVLAALDTIRARYDGEAQSRWIKAYCDGELGIKLDCHCRVFQTMSSGSDAVKIFPTRSVYNSVTDSFPWVIHFNGRSGGAPDFYRRVYER